MAKPDCISINKVYCFQILLLNLNVSSISYFLYLVPTVFPYTLVMLNEPIFFKAANFYVTDLTVHSN